MNIPTHTPLEVAEEIKDLIKDKVVCDVGCGDGLFMREMAKHAKEVFGIEQDEELCELATRNGLNVYHTDAFFEPLPKADVYYIWTKDVMGIVLKAQFEKTHGTFILGHTVRPSTLKFFKSLNPEIRESGDFYVYIKEL